MEVHLQHAISIIAEWVSGQRTPMKSEILEDGYRERGRREKGGGQGEALKTNMDRKLREM